MASNIQDELNEILNSPQIAITGGVNRCGVCGAVVTNLVPIPRPQLPGGGPVGPERYAGIECGCGRRYL